MHDHILESAIKFVIMMSFLYWILASSASKRENSELESKIHVSEADIETEQQLEPPKKTFLLSIIHRIILKPLFWISYIIFLLGAIASLVATLANLFGFQIFAALGFYLLYFLFSAAWGVLEDHRRMKRMWNEALSGS